MTRATSRRAGVTRWYPFNHVAFEGELLEFRNHSQELSPELKRAANYDQSHSLTADS